MYKVRLYLVLLLVFWVSMGGLVEAYGETVGGVSLEIKAGEEEVKKDKPLTALQCFSRVTSFGYPVMEGDLIVWSEMGAGVNKTYPCFLTIGEELPHYIDTLTKKDEKLQYCKGVIVYRTDGEALALANMSAKTRFGTEAGMTRELNGEAVSVFYQVNEDYIVFVKGATSASKKIFIISHEEPSPRQLLSANVQDIRISKHEGNNIILWREGDELFYCNLDEVGGNSATKTALNNVACKATYIEIYRDEAIYFDSTDRIHRQKLEAGSDPELIDIEGQLGPIFIVDDFLYYWRDNNIFSYDLSEDKELGAILKLEKYPLSISSNGNDIVYQASDKKIYWYAGIASLEVTNEDNCNKIRVGEEINLQARVVFRNGAEMDISSEGLWESSDTEVLTVQGGVCRAIAAGEATIKVTYEAWEASLLIKVESADELIPEKPEPQPDPHPSPGHSSSSDYSNDIVYNTERRVETIASDTEIQVWLMKHIPFNRLHEEMTWQEKGRMVFTLGMPFELWPYIDLIWDGSFSA